jgi:ankyrin repeat protein
LDGQLYIFAAYKNAPIDIIIALLNSGCDPTAQDHDGNTPIDIAKQYEHEQVIKCLLEETTAPTKSAKFLA